MSPGSYLRFLRRESRGARGRLVFFVACLSVGVAAVVAVAGVAAGFDSGLRREARRLLAADLAIEGRDPLPGEVDEAIAGLAADLGGPIERADLLELVTVVAAPPAADGTPGRSQLVELKVVDGPYPLYGTLVLRPDRPLAALLSDGAVADPDLLSRIGLGVGDELRIGGIGVPVAGVVEEEPDRLGAGIGFTAGPRLFVSREVFDRAGLEQVGSRIEYRALLRLPPGSEGRAGEAAERLEEVLPRERRIGVETWDEAQPALREGIDRAERFLGLVALVSLLIGGVGVGQTVRAWLAGRMNAIAVLKCLGMRPREVLLLYAGQTALLGLVGSVVGAAGGIGIMLLVPRLAPGLLPPDLIDPWQPTAVARGLGLGLGVALLFGLPSLAGAVRVPPARVLRRNVEPLPVALWVSATVTAVVLGGLWTTAAAQSGSAEAATWFTSGALTVTAVLAAAAYGIARGSSRLRARGTGGRKDGDTSAPGTQPRFRWRFYLRSGLAALGRPGAGTLAAVVALGLGVLVVIGLWLVERGLTGELEGNLPEEAPSAFLVDIQPEQWPPLRAMLEDADARRIDSVPVVMARISAVDGATARELTAGERESWEEEERHWALTREQRLTYLEELPADNEIVAGALWSRPGVDEVSVEEDFAAELRVGVGSTLTFDVQGVPLELTVTSIRRVDWRTFGINFFLVVEPGVLDRAPQFRIAAVDLPEGSEAAVQDRVTAAFPNVTLLQIREILDKIVTIIRAIADGVRFVGTFTVLAGVAILAGAVSAGAARRRREVALLKTLGTTRGGVVAIYSVEYALIGVVAGAIGSVGGAVLSWAVLVHGMEVDWHFDPLPLLVGLVGGAALAVIAGLAASYRALQSRPIEVLRRAM